jgi:Flp pilus assembly protein TadD
VLQAALDPVLTAVALYCVVRAWQTGRPPRFIAAGFGLGLFALNRPNVLAYAVLLPLAALVFGRGAGRSGAPPLTTPLTLRLRAVRALALALGLFLAVAPVTIRNARASGEFVLISSHGGLNFYIGNNAAADGTYRAVPGITPSIEGQARDAQRVAEAAVDRRLGPVEVSDYFSGKAWEWIRNSPGAALALFARKLRYLFSAAWLTLNYSYPYYSHDEATALRFLIVGPWLLIPLGLVGLFVPGFAQRCGYSAWLLFIPVYALSVATFFVSDRYRLPLLVPFAVASGAAIDWLWRLAGSRRRRTPAFVAASVIALAVFVNWPLGLDEGVEAERTQMMLYLIDHDQDRAAMALLQRAEPESRDRARLLATVSAAYLDHHDYARACPLLERAAAAAPDRADLSLSLGQALLGAGRPGDAVPRLRAALDAGYRPDLAALDLARAEAALGHRDEALRALAAIPDPVRLGAASQFAAGQLALDLGDPRFAEPFLRRAAGHAAPGHGTPYESLGLALMTLGRRAEAVTAFETACRLDPASPTARLNLAVGYAEGGRLADARQQVAEALRLKPDYTRARELLEAIERRVR